MSKLVRDKTESVVKHATVAFSPAAEGDRKNLLTRKLLEEVGELVTASTKQNVLQECGDVIDVVLEMAVANGIDRLDPFVEMSKKRDGRGGYDNLIVMALVEGKPPAPRVGASDYSRFGGGGYSG